MPYLYVVNILVNVTDMKKSYSLFFIALVMFSCKKDKTPADTKQYFENSRLIHFQPFRAFTKNGEITNNAIVQAYAGEFGNYFFNTASTYTDPSFQKFTVVSDDSIINNSSNVPVETKRKFVDVYDRFSSRFTDLVNDTNIIKYHIIKYKVLERKTAASGLVYYEAENPVYFLKKNSDTLFFPVIRYVIISRRPFLVSFSADKINNVFSPAGIDKLGQYDTLVVQSFDLAMKRVQ
jgi:hypothetical protein